MTSPLSAQPALRAAAALAALLAGAPDLSADDLGAVRAFRERHAARILAEFGELLALPNVADDLPNMRRNAERLRKDLERRGVAVELWSLAGAPPLVFGELRVPGAERTLGLYVHYDGQPVDPAQWTQPPWQPTLYSAPIPSGGRPLPWPRPGEPVDPEWRLYARSAADDKAPVAALTAALDALAEARITPTSNLKLLFDGEEEAGSPHLAAYLDAHSDRLEEVDVWLFCDGPVHQSRRPQLVFGVRGIAGLEVTVYGASRPLHSGHYGNWAPNPAMELAHLLASMKDRKGRVLVGGFYDDVAPLGAAEREALAALPPIDDALRAELGLAATEGDASLAERLLLPALNVRGLAGGGVGERATNSIPSQASASLDVRLVKGNDPRRMQDLVEAHIRAQGFHIVREEPDAAIRRAHPWLARVTREEGYPAARTSMELPLSRFVIAAARRVAGDDLLVVPALGGSLPLYLFTDVLERPAVIVPIANHDNNQHAPDENLRLANLWYGIDVMAALLTMD